MPIFNKEKSKDHNMQPVGLGNTRILTDYVQNSLRTLERRVLLQTTLLQIVINVQLS